MPAVRRTFALVGMLLLAAPVIAEEEGAEVYTKYCAQCHGDAGDGRGIATRFLKPAPRDFTSGKYKIRSTETGNLPTDADLERVVKLGLPYTGMPAFPNLSDQEVEAVVDYIKAFSPDFEDPDLAPTPIPLPSPPPYDAERGARGRDVYEATGCARCHGILGRGDGTSAPTLKDDWGYHIRAADLSMPWTFRGGGSREDIFRTLSTGFNGTPMPGFYGALPEEDIWSIVDYIVSLSGNTVEEPYANLVRSLGTREPLELQQELFTESPMTVLPLVGQIIEPGRNFYPSVVAVGVQAVHNRKEIAFRLSWHDMRAETVGTNPPDLPTPIWDDELASLGLLQEDVDAAVDASGFWGEEEADEDFWGDDTVDDQDGDFWGEDAVEPGGDSKDLWGDDTLSDNTESSDFWGEENVAEEGDDFWGEETDVGADDDAGGFWGDGEDAEPVMSTSDTEYSDAIALQFPLEMPQGIRLPYFLFGDTQNPVQLWHADLGAELSSLWIGRGSTALSPEDGEPPEMLANYENGEWTVLFKQSRRPVSGLTFEEGVFIPLAVTIWDGFNRERGNRRGLTPWYHLYLEPLERPSPVAPMIKAGLGVLGAEILLIAFVRLRRRQLD